MDNGIIQRYQIKGKIGAGGMGTVYRAWDRELERDVALKWLPAYLSSDATFAERFKRESLVIAHLEHPHIVPIYDVGQIENRPFIIMRLLDGGTLRDKIDRGDFNLAALVEAIEEIASALAVAHDSQIVHRDIKPGNILFDSRGSAFLSDFGIAKALDSGTQLTGTGFIGTPAYMSPEQFTGGEIDGRSDQYALAVVVYEALTGALPFEGDTATMMYQHINVSPADIDLAKHPIPVGLNPVLQKALSKETGDRYATITDFAAALADSAGTDPVNAQVLLPVVVGAPSPRDRRRPTAETEQSTPIEEAEESAGEEPVEETILEPMMAAAVDAGDVTQLEALPADAPPQAQEGKPKTPRWLIIIPAVLLLLGCLAVSALLFGGDENGEQASLSTPISGSGESAFAARAGSSAGDESQQRGLSGSGSVSTLEPGSSEQEPATVRVIDSSAELREGPGSDFPVAGEIKIDTEADVIAANEDRSWYNIELVDGERAWLTANAVEPVNAAAMNDVPVAVTIPSAP
jgi:serine/threonine-protein kinase